MQTQTPSPSADTPSPEPFDVFVIGGGINGVGIARDAAGRGLSVFLCEQGDLARGTSSASTKLIHGGLRYLELYEFRLVRDALNEREILLNAAPHIIWPMEFVLPHSPLLRPYWLIRLGLFLYDNLGRRKRLPGSYGVDLAASRFGKPLKKFLKRAFVYADCWVEDSRLVALNALDAADRGAVIHPYTVFRSARRVNDLWEVHIQRDGAPPEFLLARHIVNACGPGLNAVAPLIDGGPVPQNPLRLIKGSHIVVPRLYDGEHAYILQNTDKRIVFTIPFEDTFTLIGTTDIEVEGDDAKNPHISSEEKTYLLDAVNQYFMRQLTTADIAATFSGVRPLFDDGAADARAVTRDYTLHLESRVLNIYGGKITTYRKLAESAVDMIVTDRGEPDRTPWTHTAALPGADIGASLPSFTQSAIETYPFLPEQVVARMASHYGTRIHELLSGAHSVADMGDHIGAGLYTREVDFLMDREWARMPDDILLRRTKLGLLADTAMRQKLTFYMESRLVGRGGRNAA